MPRLRPALPLLLALCAAGCLSAEQRMARKVEGMMDAQQYDGALRYLEGYLARHARSINGWRYRVLIRLEQGERAQAAKEYARLEDALQRHEPSVLRDVVLGGGASWLLSDYAALARCGADGIVDAAFFADLLAPKHLSEGSMSKVAVGEDTVLAVLAALPGRLPPKDTWPLVVAHAEGSPERRLQATRAAGRHLAAEGMSETQIGEALDLLARAAADRSEELRETALRASLSLPEAIGGRQVAAGLVDSLLAGGDRERGMSLLLLGPRGLGAGEWPDAPLQRWAETAVEQVRVLAVALLARKVGVATPAQIRLFERAAADDEIAVRVAASVAGAIVPGWAGAPDVAATFAGLRVQDRRALGPVFARHQGPGAGAFAAAALADSDALVAEATARALALPARGPAPEIDAGLASALLAPDASVRAAAAAAAVVRGAAVLGNPVGALLAKGDDRVTEAVLRVVRDEGARGWEAAVALGLASPVPELRELAVDAAVASCDPARTDEMFALLQDADPHVAVRAASALYLLIGATTK